MFRPCPVCGLNVAEAYLQKNALRLVRCRTCGMIYANPVPAEYASGQYYDERGTDYYLSSAKLESDYAEVRFERELTLFRRQCPAGAVLDVGCSSGGFLYQLQRRFPNDYQVLGLDASGPALDYAAARGVPVQHGEFLQMDFLGRQFDAITFWAVLEHLFAPKAFIDKAGSLLKPGGRCFIIVPNMKSLAVRVLGGHYRYIYPQHLNYFTPATLKRMTESRFAIAELRATHFNPLVIWQDWRSSGVEISNAQRAALLKRTTGYKQSPWLKPIKLLYRATEKCLAAVRLADNLAAVLVKSA